MPGNVGTDPVPHATELPGEHPAPQAAFCTHVPRVSVIGAGACDEAVQAAAFALGQGLARLGVLVVTGGLGGVMAAVCAGAKACGGSTLGIVPGICPKEANKYVDIAIATGLSHMRNALVVMNGDLVVAVEGGWGTLSEFAFARKMGKVVVAMGKWSTLPEALAAHSPDHAVELVREQLALLLPDWAPPHAW
ncbi:TIGR00725 family protein [Megalodesulfovibrio paquesii]